MTKRLFPPPIGLGSSGFIIVNGSLKNNDSEKSVHPVCHAEALAKAGYPV